MLRCYITDRHSLLTGESLLDCIARSLHSGVDWIQIREKDLSARDLLALAHAALQLPNPGKTKILINSRVDVALAAEAGGAHLPSDSPSVGTWRRLVPKGFLMGVSCHDLAEVQLAAMDGADYALFGPVFSPLSKTSALPAAGLASLAEAARSVSIPILALGGITEANAPLCIAAGACGIAGITMFQRHS